MKIGFESKYAEQKALTAFDLGMGLALLRDTSSEILAKLLKSADSAVGANVISLAWRKWASAITQLPAPNSQLF